MTPRENLMTALDGRRPDWIPYTIMMLAQARTVFPDKVFWANINVGLYALPPQALRETMEG